VNNRSFIPGLVCAMLGAREHYGPMIMAEKAGWLKLFMTDLWTPWLQPLRNHVGNSNYRRAAGRFTSGMPSKKVRSFPGLGLRYRWQLKRACSRSEAYEIYEQVGSRFAKAASRYISDSHDVFLGFNSASLEALREGNRIGVRTVLDQIDPAGVEFDLVAEEEKRFPKLNRGSLPRPNRYFARISEEWQEASTVIVNSQWSKSALVRQGVPESKLAVVPLAFDPGAGGRIRRAWTGELKVLWLGTLCLRKGLPYAIQAAEKLIGSPVRFTFAGPCDVREDGLSLPSNCKYIGAIPPVDAPRLYDEHDIFIFPTISDGFGLTQLEALSFGLPVITTPCCGEAVEHKKSGFLIPASDAQALAEGIQRFVDDPELLPTMSWEAILRSRAFRSDRLWPVYGKALWPAS